MTPEEQAEIDRQVAARWAPIRAGATAPTSGPRQTLGSSVPVQRQPDVSTQEQALRDAALERYKLQDPGSGSDLAALQTVKNTEGIPAPVTTSWADQFARSLLPQMVTTDERPASATELAKNAARYATKLPRDLLMAEGDLVKAAGTGAGSLMGIDPSRNPFVSQDEKGTPTENGVLWLLRTIGTAAPAVVQETVERAPSPDIQGAENAAAKGAGMAAIVEKFFTPSTLGEQFLGGSNNDELRVQRGSTAGDWAQGVLERIERGDGFETDMARGFKNKLGQDWENTGWWLGMGIDTLVDWEGALATGPRVLRRIAHSADELGKLAPAGLKVAGSPLWEAVKGNEINGGRMIGDALGLETEAGRLDPDRLDGKLGQLTDEVSLNEYGESFRDLLNADGLAPKVADAEHLAARGEAGAIPTEHLVPPAAVNVGPAQALLAAHEARHAEAVAGARAIHEQGEAEKLAHGTRTTTRITDLERGIDDLQREAEAARGEAADAAAELDAYQHHQAPPADLGRRGPGPLERPHLNIPQTPGRVRGVLPLPESGIPPAAPVSDLQDAARAAADRVAQMEAQLSEFEQRAGIGHASNAHAKDPAALKAYRSNNAKAIRMRSQLEDARAEATRLADELKAGPARPAIPASATQGVGPDQSWRGKRPADEFARVRKSPTDLAQAARDATDRVADIERQIADAHEEIHKARRSVRSPLPFLPPDEHPELLAARSHVDRLSKAQPGSLPLPRFTSPIHTVDDFRRELAKVQAGTGGAYELRPGEGFRRMVGAESQAVTDEVYVLRDGRGEIKKAGTYAETLGELAKKPKRGWEVWYSTRRPVARWGKQGLQADHHFASDVERLVVEKMRASDAKLTNPLADYITPLSPSETVGHVLGYQITQGPGGVVGAPVPVSRSADVIRKAVALRVRDIIGADRLKALPNTAMVALEDHARVLDEAKRFLGVSVDHARDVIRGTAQLTDEEAARWRRFVPKLDPTNVTTKDWNDAWHGALNLAAGFLADARYRIQGNPSLGQMFLLAFKDPHIAARHAGKELATRGALGFLAHHVVKSFLQDPSARMPEAVRAVWKELPLALQTDANSLLREIRKKGSNLRQVVAETFRAYKLPHPTQLDRAAEIHALGHGPPDQVLAQLQDLRKEWTTPDRPEWLDNDDPVVHTPALRRWAKSTRARAVQIAEDWITTHAALAGQDVGADSLLLARIRQEIPEADMLRVYDEVVRRGESTGPETAAVLSRFSLEPAEGQSALIQWILGTRAQGLVEQSLDRLVREGIGVRSSDNRLPVLRALLEGKHRTWNDGAKRWDNLFTEQEITWANARLRDWAVLAGAVPHPADFLKNIGGDVLVPKFLADEARRLTAVGGFKSSTDLTPSTLLNSLFILWKQIATHGYIIPNPAHYVGQMVSLIPTLVTTLGVEGAASALGTLLWKDTALVGEMVKRVGGHSYPNFFPRVWESEILKTANGELFHIDELEDIARRFALGETRPDFEVGQQIAALMNRGGEEPLMWQRLKESAEWWQDHVKGMAGAFDLHGRMAVFIDEIKRGTPPEQAALKAREAMLDFRDMTAFESRYMRLLFTFYAFMRKNSDAYVRAMILHPARVTSQMRLAHAELTHSGLTNVELGAMTDSDIARLVLYSDKEVVSDSGRAHPLYKLNRVTSSPVGVGEFLGTLRMLMPGQDTRGLLQAMNPAAQAMAILLQGRKLDRSIDRPWNNRIPPFLLDIPGIGDWLGDAVGAGPESLTKYDDPLLADEDATNAAGVPAYWAAGVRYSSTTPGTQEAQRRLWQEISLFVGRPLGNIEAAAEGLNLEAIPPNVSQSEQLFDALLGFKHRPVLNEQEAVRRFELQRESNLHDMANTVRPPEGIGPR